MCTRCAQNWATRRITGAHLTDGTDGRSRSQATRRTGEHQPEVPHRSFVKLGRFRTKQWCTSIVDVAAGRPNWDLTPDDHSPLKSEEPDLFSAVTPIGPLWSPQTTTAAATVQTVSIVSLARAASAIVRMCLGFDVATASCRRMAPSTTVTSTMSS